MKTRLWTARAVFPTLCNSQKELKSRDRVTDHAKQNAKTEKNAMLPNNKNHIAIG